MGVAIASWFYEIARLRDEFDVEFVDLAEYNLPLFDEPVQPIRREYTHEHTQRWSETINRGDAYVFVIPEYNHSLNAATKNAVDYLHWEWRYKPYGIVCYGVSAAGLRAAQVLKPVLAALKVTLCGDVSVSLRTTPVVDGVFPGTDALVASANVLLDELNVFTPLLKTLRPS